VKTCQFAEKESFSKGAVIYWDEIALIFSPYQPCFTQ